VPPGGSGVVRSSAATPKVNVGSVPLWQYETNVRGCCRPRVGLSVGLVLLWGTESTFVVAAARASG